MVEELGAATRGSVAKVLLRIFREIWKYKVIPTEWKHLVIISIHKKKDKLDFSNYRNIRLLCDSNKIFSFLILQNIKGRTEEILAKAQCGFRDNRSTIDQIFNLRQVVEKHKEFGKDLYVCYIDFRNAFHSIWKKGL